MKLTHEDMDVDININIPTGDLEDLIDKATTSVITIVWAVTAAQVVKALLTCRSQ